MVQLIDSDIQTREVLDWRGMHIFHARMSSCSQKLRIYLNLKGIEWQPHELNLSASESYTDWYLGINPRGLVPVLVWDGAVHIESNDIITLLEQRFPAPRLIPAEHAGEIATLLRHEDELHLDLRTLSFRFVYGRTGSPKTPGIMQTYRCGGSGTVAGKADEHKRGAEIDFYERLAEQGITDDAVRQAAGKFRAAFDDLEQRLKEGAYCFGGALTVLDIAWFVYATRLELAGYPFPRLYPGISGWMQRLGSQAAFADEVRPAPALSEAAAANRREQEQTGTTLSEIAGL